MKIKTKKLRYFIKTNSSVNGIGFNPFLKNSKIFELNNSQINKEINFWNEDEEYDKENPGNGEVYFLLYSNQNIQNNKPYSFVNDGSSVTVKAEEKPSPESRRLLTEEPVQETSGSSAVNIYFSKYEMDDEFNPIKGFPWWLILIICLSILLIILLIVFLIWCCCCRNKNKNNQDIYQNQQKQVLKPKSVPKNETPPEPNTKQNSSKISNPHSYYEDGFLPPVYRKDGDSKVNNYMPSQPEKEDAL